LFQAVVEFRIFVRELTEGGSRFSQCK